MSLKQKTVGGFFWSFIDNVAQYGVTFIVGIILARLLSPEEFGIIGMTTLFFAIGQAFINSGFSEALIRKKDASDTDYSTIFYFNFLVGILTYIILYFIAVYIADFMNEPALEEVIKVTGIVLVIGSSSAVQLTMLKKKIDFKTQTIITLVSSVTAGGIAIVMAYMDYGVWSLVARIIIAQVLATAMYWVFGKWYPKLVFSKKSLSELFVFGSNLLISRVMNVVYKNLYYFVIGKYFSAAELGYYSRADHFKQIPSVNLTAIINRVSFPVLSSINDDIPRMKEVYRKLIKASMLMTFILMLGMAASAESLTVTLVGEKWMPSVIYLQLLCFVGLLYPLHALNISMLHVQGLSGKFLTIEIIKKILAVPNVIIGIMFGIEYMIMGIIVTSVIAFFINSYWSGKLIKYTSFEQIRDIIPSFLVSAVVAAVVYWESFVIDASQPVIFSIQIVSGAVLFFGICELLRLEEYNYMKKIVLDKIKKR